MKPRPRRNAPPKPTTSVSSSSRPSVESNVVASVGAGEGAAGDGATGGADGAGAIGDGGGGGGGVAGGGGAVGGVGGGGAAGGAGGGASGGRSGGGAAGGGADGGGGGTAKAFLRSSLTRARAALSAGYTNFSRFSTIDES